MKKLKTALINVGIYFLVAALMQACVLIAKAEAPVPVTIVDVYQDLNAYAEPLIYELEGPSHKSIETYCNDELGGIVFLQYRNDNLLCLVD